jgi:hypothetical protein
VQSCLAGFWSSSYLTKKSREIAALPKSGSVDVNSCSQIVIGGWTDKLSQTGLATVIVGHPPSASSLMEKQARSHTNDGICYNFSLFSADRFCFGSFTNGRMYHQ